MKNPLSLREIPQVLFREFSISDEPQQAGSFKPSPGNPFDIKICLAQETGKDGPFTLMFRNYICREGRRHRTSLQVFDYPVNYPLMLHMFSPTYTGPSPEKIMEVRFFAEDPPYFPPNSYNRRWEMKKGFWAKEHLKVEYGDTSHGHSASIISNSDDWEFGFFLKIQCRAYSLAKQVIVRGHWQHDWNPKGDFFHKPQEH